MNVYAVIHLKRDENPDEFVKNVQELDAAAFVQYASEGVCFIRFNGTARQLSEKVGFSKNDNPKTGIVIGVSQYFGFASGDLWNWMKVS